jgi:hypothetical protein
MKLLFRLLRKNVNFLQMSGFALANLVGAVIVLFGIQAFVDAGQLLQSPDSVLGSNVLVLSKPVSSVNTFAGAFGAGPRSFSEHEIEELESVDGVTSVSTFRTAQFPVYGGLTYGGLHASTEMFVESVPDAFLDVEPSLWNASVDGEILPVIIPRTYLNFYNYGFAAARGTPQLGEELFSMVPLDFTFRGREGRKKYTGRIVGLTERMNTILVPDEFLAEANERFAVEGPMKPTRVLIEAGSSASKELMDFIDKKGYVLDGGSEDSIRLLAVVRTIISIVVAVGLLVSALSFYLLLISILLLIEKNRYKNDVLHQLGYPFRTIALPYQSLAVCVDVVVWLAAVVLVILLYPMLNSLMQTISPGFESSGSAMVLLSGLGLCLLFAAIHILLIRHKIRSR